MQPKPNTAPMPYGKRTPHEAQFDARMHEYSVSKVLRHLATGDHQMDGFEADVERAFGNSAGTAGRFGKTVTIPWGALGAPGRRDLNTATLAAGGSLVGYTVGPAADVLRPYNVATRAGMTVLSGLKGATFIPGVLEEIQFGWLVDEQSTGPNLTPTLGLAQMRPHVACGVVTVPGQLLRLASPTVVDAFVRRRLALAAGQLIDRVVLDGRSNGGTPTADDMAEPLGLCNTAGVLAFNASEGRELGDGINPAMTAVLARAGSDDGASFILGSVLRQLLLPNFPNEQGAMAAGALQGKPAHCTSGMRSNAGAYGDWGNAVLALFGEGIEIAVDPFTGFRNDLVTLRCMVTMDVAFPNPGAFAVVTRTI
jgi:hypothetical protein